MKKLFIMILAFALILSLAGCGAIQFKPSEDVARYEAFGGTVGGYMKAKNPEDVIKTLPHVKAVYKMSDGEIASADVVQVAYQYFLKEHPEDATLTAMIKGGIDLLGLNVNLSYAGPVEVERYAKLIRAVLKGYLGAVE